LNNPLRYKRSEALPGFTVDLAKGTVVADAVSPASLSSSFSGRVSAEAMAWLRRGFAGAELARGGFLDLRDALYMASGGFRVVPRGEYASGLKRLIVYGSLAAKRQMRLPARLTHAGETYDDLARLAAPNAKAELARTMGTKGFWIATIGAAVLVNVIDYGWGSKADVGLGSPEFYAALTVDIALGLTSGAVGVLTVLVLSVLPVSVPASVTLIVFFAAQAVFTYAFPDSWRERAVQEITELYATPPGPTVGCGPLVCRSAGPMLR
jgi:hypothetical protein